MNFLLLLLSGVIATVSGLSIRTFQLHIQKHPLQMQFYQVLSMSIGSIIYLVLSGFTFPATSAAWALALAFAVCLAASSIGYAEAMHNGPFSLTGIINSCNVLIPILIGWFFFREQLQLPHIVGIVLLLCTFVLPSLGAKGEEKEVRPIWYFLILLSFLGNGFGAVILSAFNKLPDPGSSDSFMAAGFLFGALLILAYVLLCKARKPDSVIALQPSWALVGLLGASAACVFGCNSVLIRLAAVYPSSMLFPVYNGISSVLSCLASCLLFREHINKKKLLTIILGIGAVVLLNL